MEDKKIRVYLCEDSLEGILSAVHAAYHSRYGHRFIRLQEGDYIEQDLFSDYVQVRTDFAKADSVARSVRQKISVQAWDSILKASLHYRTGKAQDIYRFLNYGYQMGGSVINYIGEEHIQRVMFDGKTVSKEYDRMMGFTRFQELEDGSLFARIGPKSNLVPLLAGHFADRFPEERWTIYDENRHLMAYHVPNLGWNMMKGDLSKYLPEENVSQNQREMEDCWKTFFETIAIEARKNLKYQQQMLPKYYRKYFSKSGDKSFD